MPSHRHDSRGDRRPPHRDELPSRRRRDDDYDDDRHHHRHRGHGRDDDDRYYEDDRRHSSRHHSSSHRQDDRRRDNNDDRQHHHRGSKASSGTTKYRNGPLGTNGQPPNSYRCPICAQSTHWIIECPTVVRYEEFYPHIDRRDGCVKCGQPGHVRGQCKNSKDACGTCGSLHIGDSCPFSRKPDTWHEFYDTVHKAPYYISASAGTTTTTPTTTATSTAAAASGSDAAASSPSPTANNNPSAGSVDAPSPPPPATGVPTWEPPAHPQDEVLWHCDKCSVLIPASTYHRCPGCGSRRQR